MARVSREGVARNNDGPDPGTGVDAAVIGTGLVAFGGMLRRRKSAN